MERYNAHSGKHRVQSNSRQEVTVQQLVYGGEGLCRLESGEVVLVPWAAPGDRLAVRMTGYHKRVLHGEIEAILTPSAQRVPPPCSVFGQCGGCQWQHINIQAQRQWKQKIVAESLARSGKFTNIPVNDTLGEDEPFAWHYRNKVEWIVLRQDGTFRLGYSRFKSHEDIVFDHCWIIPDRLNVLARWLETLSTLLSQTRRLQVRVNHENRLLLTFWGTETLESSLSQVAEHLVAAFPEISGIIFNHDNKDTCIWGAPALVDTIRNKHFKITPGSFFQINHQVAQQMLTHLETVAPENIPSLVDIYAGSGFFAIHLSQRAARIVAVESSPEAVANGQANLALNHINHIEFKTGMAEHVLKQLDENFAVALVDPPRKGCNPGVLCWINNHVTQQLIYISCNPATLARDLKHLSETGWRIVSVQPFDMFPQTYHVETIATLSRS